MKNKEIRRQIESVNLHYWEIAEAIGIHPSTLCLWLRKELEGEQLEKVQAAIDSLSKARRG